MRRLLLVEKLAKDGSQALHRRSRKSATHHRLISSSSPNLVSNKNPLEENIPAPDHCDIVKGPSLLRTSVQRPRPSLLFLPGLRSLPFWTQYDANSQTNRVAYQDKTVSWAVEHLQANVDIIRAEYDKVARSLKSDYQTDTEHTLHEGAWDWHSYMLKGKIQGHFCTHFPETSAILQTLRDEGQLFEGTPFGYSFFSTLHPQSKISAHTAPMNLRVRIHLPLKVPAALSAAASVPSRPACGIRVGTVEREWLTGQALVLDDSFEHQVWNDTDETRVLLLVDVWHPDVTFQERKDIIQLFDHARGQGWWSAE